ncbi:hypothetical protein AVEN_168480-1 [Araneus ventricosus]|uniref:ACAD9/ACADV-like C-terminal domain-containing protein n=1 Tax=Araneus ventricosus TaxID=182803 RepID=A0A4Y2WIQ3_ARAVE|nr:hypothetical protein AVEN_168480-1 [Araneus ventricosus]
MFGTFHPLPLADQLSPNHSLPLAYGNTTTLMLNETRTDKKFNYDYSKTGLLCIRGDEQFLLNRLANAAIDIYAMSSILSRATFSLNKNAPSAAYEEKLVNVYCGELAKKMEIENKLDDVKPLLAQWNSSLSCRYEVIFTRLSIGHSQLTN